MRRSLRREIKLSQMFCLILLIFLFGFLPYGITRSMDVDNSLHPDVFIFLTVLFIISISISPVIFGVMNKQIGDHCIILLRLIFMAKKNVNEMANESAKTNTRTSVNTC